MAALLSIVLRLLVTLIRMYQFFISSSLKPHCRFYPTCSQYAIESLQSFGITLGSILILKRILRCQPFSKSGYDPVPPRPFHIREY
ncbi:MAG: membrane protein insertion efficiency factor YidD [Pantoea sp. Edef]|nr:membrane protein insertion efficiency factor YidD [Pantoea sp. Edef]